MTKPETIPRAATGRKRRFTSEQKRAFLDEAARTGNSISEVARLYSLAPSMMFQWRRAMDDASDKSLKANEKVVPESEVKLKARIRDLERALGKKSLQVDVLEEAVEIAREKKLISRGNSSDGEGQ